MPLSPTGKITILVLTFASFVLTFIVYLAPEMYNHHNVSLITVFPSTVVIDPGTAQAPMDGPTVILGVFGMKILVNRITKINFDRHRV